MKSRRKWMKERPEVEGWWFWRRTVRTNDSWKWNAYYIMPNDQRVTKITDAEGNPVPWSIWEGGMEVDFPAGGWWSWIQA